MNDSRISHGLRTPRVVGSPSAGEIGGPQWNIQAVIDDQLRDIARNDRIIARGLIVIIIEVVVAVLLVLVMHLIVA